MSSSSTAARSAASRRTWREPRPDGRLRPTGTLGAPLNLVNKRFELTYATDWQPIELKIDATIADLRDPKAEPRVIGLATSFATTTAINEVTQNGVTASKTDQITARTVVHAEQLLRRLRGARRAPLVYDAGRRAADLRGAAGGDQGRHQGGDAGHL